MTHFYQVGDDSLGVKGFPWAAHIVSGLVNRGDCPKCYGGLDHVAGHVKVVLEKRKGTRWPDALGCGAEPLFIVSKRALEAWARDGIGRYPKHKLTIVPPLPKMLEGQPPPHYFWLDGEKMMGAKLDFEASGFVGARVCPRCGRRIYNVAATYERHHGSGVTWPFEFRRGTWNGANVFTTDLSPLMFFCTEKVVDCAREHKLLNFSFVPCERAASTTEPIRYL